VKILHIWDVAGVANTIAKFMDRLYGTRSELLVRKKFDVFGFTTQGQAVGGGPWLYGMRCLLKARHFDLVHVHNWVQIIPWLKQTWNKPMILTLHNMSARNNVQLEERRYIPEYDALTVVTANLLPKVPKAILIPNPVDTDLFKEDHHFHQRNTALHADFWAEKEARFYSEKMGLSLDILYRHTHPIPHSSMPDLLGKYEYYIDIKRSVSISPEIIPALSKTGLEALAVGCKVIRWDGEIVYGLPDENRPENVIKKYYDLYHNVLGGGWKDELKIAA